MSKSLEKDGLKNALQRMDNYDFEHFVADLWEQQGWNTEVEQQSSDAGIDVRATKTTPYPQKQLIQAKRYGSSTKVGGPDIQQYASLRHQEEGVDSVVVVTSSSYTRSAKSRASDLNVKLVDGDDLVSMIHDLDAHHVVDRYLNTATTKQGNTTLEAAITQPSRDRSQPETQELNLPLLTIEYSKGDLIHGFVTSDVKTHYIIYAGIIGWILALSFSILGFEILPGIIAFMSWGLVPIGIIADSSQVTNLSVTNIRWLFSVLGSFIPVFGLIPTLYYLNHRQKVVRQNY